MLMRFAKVTPEGVYVPPPPSNSKASYATMLFVRADIVRNAGSVLARAVTIGTRYAAVRRQTATVPTEKETQVRGGGAGQEQRQGQRQGWFVVNLLLLAQVLDYQNCSYTLLPLVASTYALTFMGETLFGMYQRFEEDRDRGDFTVRKGEEGARRGAECVQGWGWGGCRVLCWCRWLGEKVWFWLRLVARRLLPLFCLFLAS